MRSSAVRCSFTSLLLVYVFVVSSLSPLATAAGSSRTGKPIRTSQGQVNAPHRDAELLVRFRSGVSLRDQETILATRGARKKKDLQGESGIEKLELLTGRDAR